MACIQLYSESSLGDFLLPLIFHEFQGKHGFWFDIQDVTGTTLSAKARFQINMNVPRIEGYTDLAKINTTVIPILWMEEGIDELGSELIGVLKQAVIDPQEWRQVIINLCRNAVAVCRLLLAPSRKLKVPATCVCYHTLRIYLDKQVVSTLKLGHLSTISSATCRFSKDP